MRQGRAPGWVSCNGLCGPGAIFPQAIMMLLSMPSLRAQPGQGLLTVIFQLSPSPCLLSHHLSDRFQLCGTPPPSSPHPVPIDRPFLYSICLWHQNDRQREEGGRHRWPRLENVTESGRWGGQSQMTQRWQWWSTQGKHTLWLFTRSWGLMAGFVSLYCLSVSPGPSPVSAQSMNNTSSLKKPNISL